MKSYVTSGTGSQQTLTGSQDEKVAIYQTLADAEADLANLEAGQIVATPDTGDENAQPVDSVTDGDMHAVTSNAVADKISSLDVSSVGGSGKYISAISETDGKINATATDLATSVVSGNTSPVTSGAVADSLSVKLPVRLFTVTNDTGNLKYYKVNNIFPHIFGEVVYFMQARAGELIVISAGHGDGDAYATPKAKRLLNTYSKIAGLRYNGSVLYFALSAFSHSVVFTKMSGNWDLTRSSLPVQEVSASEYNSATAITIET